MKLKKHCGFKLGLLDYRESLDYAKSTLEKLKDCVAIGGAS
jgi:hypothetical protein